MSARSAKFGKDEHISGAKRSAWRLPLGSPAELLEPSVAWGVRPTSRASGRVGRARASALHALPTPHTSRAWTGVSALARSCASIVTMDPQDARSSRRHVLHSSLPHAAPTRACTYAAGSTAASATTQTSSMVTSAGASSSGMAVEAGVTPASAHGTRAPAPTESQRPTGASVPARLPSRGSATNLSWPPG